MQDELWLQPFCVVCVIVVHNFLWVLDFLPTVKNFRFRKNLCLFKVSFRADPIWTVTFYFQWWPTSLCMICQSHIPPLLLPIYNNCCAPLFYLFYILVEKQRRRLCVSASEEENTWKPREEEKRMSRCDSVPIVHFKDIDCSWHHIYRCLNACKAFKLLRSILLQQFSGCNSFLNFCAISAIHISNHSAHSVQSCCDFWYMYIF